MVKVGNSECEFLKLTPLSRSSAIAGAVCGVTMRPRRPSGTNRIRLRGLAFWADAEPAASVISPADSNRVVRRIRFSPTGKRFRRSAVAPGLVLLCDRIVTLCGTGLKGEPPGKSRRVRSKVWTDRGNIGALAPFSLQEASHEQVPTEGRSPD